MLWAIIVIWNVRLDGGGLWRTRAGLAKIMPLDPGWAVFVALRAEGFVSSSSLWRKPVTRLARLNL
jgi:hypothetical protein